MDSSQQRSSWWDWLLAFLLALELAVLGRYGALESVDLVLRIVELPLQVDDLSLETLHLAHLAPQTNETLHLAHLAHQQKNPRARDSQLHLCRF